MKLFEVPNKTYVKVGTDTYFFDHIDGMYSYCKTMSGETIHLYAGSEVTISELNNNISTVLGAN